MQRALVAPVDQSQHEELVMAVYIHGTTIPTVKLGRLQGITESAAKFAASVATPKLFAARMDMTLIPLNQSTAAAKNFDMVFAHFTKPENRFSFEWSGNLGKDSWKTAATALVKAIEERRRSAMDKLRPSRKLKIKLIAIGQSHGLQIIHGAATHYAENKDTDVQFYAIGIGSPLSIHPAQIMPLSNCSVWLQFYSRSDWKQIGGTFFMQDFNCSLDVTRKIKKVWEVYKQQNNIDIDTPLPAGWKSFAVMLSSCQLCVHDNLVDKPAADQISATLVNFLSLYLTMEKELSLIAKI